MKGEINIQPIAERIIAAHSEKTNGFPCFAEMLEALKQEVDPNSFTKDELYEFYLNFRLHIALSMKRCYSNGDGNFRDTDKITQDAISDFDVIVHNLHNTEKAYSVNCEKLIDAIREVEPNYQPKFDDVECNVHPDLSEATLITVMRNLALDGELELVLKKKEP